MAYRLRHLRDPRLQDGRDGRGEGGELGGAAVAAAGPPRDRHRAAGRGISCVLYEGDNGYCAMVAEVDVDQATGRSPSRAWSWRRTAVRSRTRTA